MEPPERQSTHIKIGFFNLFLFSIGWYSENFVVIFSVRRICGKQIQQHKYFMISTHLVHIKNAGTYKHHLYGSPGFRILVLGNGDEY